MQPINTVEGFLITRSKPLKIYHYKISEPSLDGAAEDRGAGTVVKLKGRDTRIDLTCVVNLGKNHQNLKSRKIPKNFIFSIFQF